MTSAFIRSLGHAWAGIKRVTKTERNFKIHLFVALLVFVAGILRRLTNTQWLILILLIAIILCLEIFNSAIEEICNLLTRKLNLGYEETKFPRDFSAGAVLILAIATVLIGLIIFL